MCFRAYSGSRFEEILNSPDEAYCGGVGFRKDVIDHHTGEVFAHGRAVLGHDVRDDRDRARDTQHNTRSDTAPATAPARPARRS